MERTILALALLNSSSANQPMHIHYLHCLNCCKDFYGQLGPQMDPKLQLLLCAWGYQEEQSKELWRDLQFCHLSLSPSRLQLGENWDRSSRILLWRGFGHMWSPKRLDHPDVSRRNDLWFSIFFLFFFLAGRSATMTCMHKHYIDKPSGIFLLLFTAVPCISTTRQFDPSNSLNVLKVNWCTVLNSLVTSWIRLIEPVMNRVSIVNSHS